MDKSDLPTIFETSPAGKEPLKRNLKLQPNMKNLPKLILVVLGVVILVELVLGAKTLLQNKSTVAPGAQPTTGVVNKIRPIDGAKIYLLAERPSYQVGDNLNLRIFLDTGGHTVDGVDTILRYDPKLFQASSSGIIKGKIFQEFPLTQVDEKSGVVNISGISSIQSKGYNGMGDFATIRFKALSKGPAAFSLEFKPGTTTNSNVVEVSSGQNILEEVKNISVSIN
jgi:hypothetical protein